MKSPHFPLKIKKRGVLKEQTTPTSSVISGIIGDGLEIGDRFPVAVMGVINTTENSFYSGSVRRSPDDILKTAIEMEKAGAAIIDIGARSTAPYREYDISEQVETRVLRDAIRAIKGKVQVPISADTTRIGPARIAIKEGVEMINDAYGFTQRNANEFAHLIASKECSLLITAHEGRSGVIHEPIQRVSTALARALSIAEKAGITSNKIVVDPGIGFFSDSEISNAEWNCRVIEMLPELRVFKRPVCVGVSRKKFIGTLTDGKPAEARLAGSLAATSIAVVRGAHIVRTHDVPETVDAVRVATALRDAQPNRFAT
ncbi:MAG TPA: dihydropteroate synthase [Nitrososphaerales archaeon]|nr:dihydropteroate synthase [Nitrososphaerales archaeon]